MSLEQMTPFVHQYGYWLLIAVGFMEYVGVPLASMPVLVVTGALIAKGVLAPVPAVLSVVFGGLMGDGVWYTVARLRGRHVLNRVCGITTNPRACIFGVTSRVERIGPAYVLPAKFIPGTGNLIAAAAGLAGVRARTFFVYDAVALTIWAVAYTTVGRAFADQVELGVGWVMGTARLAGAGALLLVLVAVVVRWAKVRLHERAHQRLGGLDVVRQTSSVALPAADR